MKPGVKMEPYQLRIARKKRGPIIELGETIAGTWIMPTISKDSGETRNRSALSISDSDDDNDAKAARMSNSMLNSSEIDPAKGNTEILRASIEQDDINVDDFTFQPSEESIISQIDAEYIQPGTNDLSIHIEN